MKASRNRPLLERLRQSRLFKRAASEVWVPAPRPVVGPGAAGVPWNQLRMPQAVAGLAAPPLFICGSARSGTTWTYDLFDRHPEVHAICESWVLSQTQGVTSILTQEYWDLQTKAAWEERVDMPFGTVQLLPYADMVHDLAELVGTWLMRRAQAPHRYLAAKEPIDVRAASILFPEARFLHVVRDGRDVVSSMRRAGQSWDPSMGARLPMRVRAEAWRRQVENVRSHRDALGDRYMEVRYEDLQTDPVATIRSMFEFAAIRCDDSLLAELQNATRLERYAEKAHRSGFRGGAADGGWRAEFSARDARQFAAVAGDLLVELGYERDSRGWSSRAPIRRALHGRQIATQG